MSDNTELPADGIAALRFIADAYDEWHRDPSKGLLRAYAVRDQLREIADELEAKRPVVYLSRAQIGAWFGVEGGTVAKWQERYADTRPCPEPDVLVGSIPGWLPSRAQEWREWEAGRPGQGAPGRPKPRQAQMTLAELDEAAREFGRAAARGLAEAQLAAEKVGRTIGQELARRLSRQH